MANVVTVTLQKHVLGFATLVPTYVDAAVLAADTAETFTCPTDANFVIFSSTGDFFAKYDGAATVPAADITDGTAPELNPIARLMDGGTSISLIASAATTVTLSYYAVDF